MIGFETTVTKGQIVSYCSGMTKQCKEGRSKV